MRKTKKLMLILAGFICSLCFQSCYTTKYVDHYVSIINDLNSQYIGRTSSYIIENFPYSPTDVKHIDNQYDIIIFERARNYVVGNGITKFHMKNGKCYKIETNEYKNEPRLEKVSIF